MKRPSKKEIKEAIEKLKEHKEGTGPADQHVPKPSGKKGNQGKIRKKGV